ncbi:MAG: arsenical pump-driving ATPase [Proteobacteria bacterium]|nr:arsenical pump-driving ATPase [Pseudomonadota bacterium]
MNTQFSTTSIKNFIESIPQYLFFTGKGGVGKTSLACTSAIALADRGKQVLLVSTDPASNLDEVLGTKLESTPSAIPEVTGLFALNINPEIAAQKYRERLISPYRDQFPESVIKGMEEQLSGACTLEIAAFDEFCNLLGDPTRISEFDHVIFDTAPTGHTLRLLTLPKAWNDFLDNNTSGMSCLGPLAGLEKQQKIYQESVAALVDNKRTTMVLVSRPQEAALKEMERTSIELAAIGVTNQKLILNGVFHRSHPSDSIAIALENRGETALKEKKNFLEKYPLFEVPLHAHNLLGIASFRFLMDSEVELTAGNSQATAEIWKPDNLPDLESLVDDLAKAGSGVIMTMGKGGVGKTTIAVDIAAQMAQRGLKVHLSTTDPAAHVADLASGISGIKLSRIDPAVETKAYIDHVMSTEGKDLGDDERALLQEDLSSPCTEEIAVFLAFSRIVAEGKDQFVILDTAPTGHTLLLLDASQSYQSEVTRLANETPEEVNELLNRLRDSNFTKVLVVTLPESTPVHEAAHLQEDLRRAEIEPYAWVINQSFHCSGSQDALLEMRGLNEQTYIREVVDELSSRTVIIPWKIEK